MVDMKRRIVELLDSAIRDTFPEGDLTELDLFGLLEVPPDPTLGDCAFPCFRLAKSFHLTPPKIAQMLSKAVHAPEIATAHSVGAYVNFTFNRENFAGNILPKILSATGDWGGGSDGFGQTICIDYSSINIAKRFHIGHLSSTMIGHSLKRIYDFLGYRTVGINHLGDWGTQFGRLIAAYRLWGDEVSIERDGVEALGSLYVRFHQESSQKPELEDEGRRWFRKIEEGDAEALAIFDRFKQLTLRDVNRVYDMLGVSFDSYAGESFYNDKMDRVVSELREKSLLVESNGAQVVDLASYGLPPCLILKSDGATLYATRDIAAALYRKETYGFSKCLYVVAYQQDMHFKQVFKVLELMGYQWARDEMEHVAFGMVSYEGQTLSTRHGNTIYLDELLMRAQEKALAIIHEKSPELSDKQAAARQVGIGAIVFWDLYNSRIKDIDFWWDRALNFDGETGPYVQYTHARCCSVLKKAPEKSMPPDYKALMDDEAQALLRLLSRFPEAVREAADRYEPSMVTRATTEIAKAYNRYYYNHRILGSDAQGEAARLQLTDATRLVLKTGLYLIGVEAPERM